MEGVYIIVSYRRIWWLAELCKTSGRISFCEKLVRFYRSSEKKLIIEALKSREGKLVGLIGAALKKVIKRIRYNSSKYSHYYYYYYLCSSMLKKKKY